MNQEQLNNQISTIQQNAPVLIDSAVKTGSAIIGLGCHYLGLLLDKTAKAANQIERRVIQ